MRTEVESAAVFLGKLLARTKRKVCTAEAAENFTRTLQDMMCTHYQNHWFPEKPFKGSAYRCLRIVNQKVDPIILRAAAECDMTQEDLLKVLPNELTLWVDPDEVSYRIGEDGSIGVIFGRDADSSSDDEGCSSGSESERSNSPVSARNSPQPMAMSSPTPLSQQVQAAPAHMSSGSISPPLFEHPPTHHTDMVQHHHHIQGCKNDFMRSSYLPSPTQEHHQNLVNNLEFLATYVSS